MTSKEVNTLLNALANSIIDVEQEIDALILENKREEDDSTSNDEACNLTQKVHFLHKRNILQNGKGFMLLKLDKSNNLLTTELKLIKSKSKIKDDFHEVALDKQLKLYFVNYIDVASMLINLRLQGKK